MACNKLMDPDVFPPIPHDTAKVAGLIFGKSNFYMLVGDQANRLLSGFQWQDSFSQLENSKHTLPMLYLITYFQLMESLPDHTAADALSNRIDWKYALHLPLNYSGWDAYFFCDFRQWLLKKQSRQQAMEKLISRLSQMSPAMGKSIFSLNTVQALTNICLLSRLEVVYQSVKRAIEALNSHGPLLLQEIILSNWYARFSEFERSMKLGADNSDLESFARLIGIDAFHLLDVISASGIPGLANLPETKTLVQVMRNQYALVDGKILWRKEACAHCTSITRDYSADNHSANNQRESL